MSSISTWFHHAQQTVAKAVHHEMDGIVGNVNSSARPGEPRMQRTSSDRNDARTAIKLLEARAAAR